MSKKTEFFLELLMYGISIMCGLAIAVYIWKQKSMASVSIRVRDTLGFGFLGMLGVFVVFMVVYLFFNDFLSVKNEEKEKKDENKLKNNKKGLTTSSFCYILM